MIAIIVSGEKTEARVIEPISNLTELFGNQTSETNITELHKIANSSIVGNESLSFNVSISDELGNDTEKLLPLQANYTVFFNGTTVNGSELHLNGSINVGNESINSNQSVSLIISAKENSQANATGNVTEFSSKKKDTKEEFVSEPRRSYDEAPLSLVEILRNISDFIHNKSMSDLMKQRYKLKHQPDGSE